MTVLARALVERPQLMGRLEALPGGSVVTVSAGAGSGKSTLLQQWAESGPTRMAIVRITPESTAVKDVVRQTLSALAPEIEGVARIQQAVDQGQTDWFEFVLPALTHVLTLSPAIVAFDDVHLLDGKETVSWLGQLAWMADATSIICFSGRHIPAGLTEAPGVLGRLHAVDAEDLSLSLDDVMTLSRRGWTGPRLRKVHELTHGWTMGVALLLMSDRAEQADAPDSLEGALLSDVVAPLDDHLLQFLLASSALSPARPDELDAVLGRDDSVRWIDYLAERPMPFLEVRPGTRAPEVVVHALLADALARDPRAREWVSHRAEVLRRAAQWAEEEGDMDRAFASFSAPVIEPGLPISCIGRVAGRWSADASIGSTPG